ncbi:hypothetical protein EUTSA_v10011940mg, partial [Eutrema salsugineum]
LNPKSLAKMQCTRKFMKSHISEDPEFKSEYPFRLNSSLLHISRGGSTLVCFHPVDDSRLFLNNDVLERSCQILGIQNRTHNRTPHLKSKQKCRFLVSRTTIMCLSSNLMTEMKPVYLESTLHWLRNDKIIIAFNPRIEQARYIIPRKPHLEPVTKLLFGVGDNCLTLISATMEMIYGFTLESIHTNPKWILTRQIMNEAVNESIMLSWDVKAYDVKCLVVRTMTNLTDHRVVYGYDLKANKWGIVRSIPRMCDGLQDFFLYQHRGFLLS